MKIKREKIVSIFFITFLMIANQSTYAGPGGSTGVGGGGDVIILPDDSVVLADPWIDSGAPQPNNMPPLRALNPRILQSISAYARASQSLLIDLGNKGKSEISDLLNVLATRKNDLRFYGVQSAEELNNFCAPGGRKIYKLPNGATVQQVACTAGNETFIVEPLFLRLSMRDQVLLLVHERLTTLRDQYGGKNYSAVARFTSGLGVYLNLYSEQSLKKYRNLTDIEEKLLTDFFIAIEEIEKRNEEVGDNSFQWKAHTYGGGPIHLSSSVDPSALIGLNSFVPRNSVIETGVKIINLKSDLRVSLEVGKNSSILDSSIVFTNGFAPEGNAIVKLHNDVKISSTIIRDLKNTFEFANNNTVSKSEIRALNFFLDESSKIVNSKIIAPLLHMGTNIEFNSSNFSYPSFEQNINIASGEKLINATADESIAKLYFPQGVTVKPISFSIPVNSFTCKLGEKINKDIDLKFMNKNNEGLVIKGKANNMGVTSIFKKEWNFSYDNLVVNVSIKTFDTATDNSQLVLDKNGHFVLPGYSKTPFEFDLNHGLGTCAAQKIIESIKKSGSFKADSNGYAKLSIYPEAL